MATDTQQILDAAKEQGFEVTTTGKDHYRIKKAGALGGYTMSKSPSDWRNRNNVISGLKKMGFVWPASAYVKPEKAAENGSALTLRQRVVTEMTGRMVTAEWLATRLEESQSAVQNVLTRLQEEGDVSSVGHNKVGKHIYKLGAPEPTATAKKPKARRGSGRSGGIVGRTVLAVLAERGTMQAMDLKREVLKRVDCAGSSVSSAASYLVADNRLNRSERGGRGYTYSLPGWQAPERGAAIICGPGDVDETMGTEAASPEEAKVAAQGLSDDLTQNFKARNVSLWAERMTDPKQRYISILLARLEQEWSDDIANRLDRMLEA